LKKGFGIRYVGFDVKDTRVTVAGAARSGVAAAELLARRGARVTLSEAGTTVGDAERLRKPRGSRSRSVVTCATPSSAPISSC